MVYSLGQELVCEDLTVNKVFKAENIGSFMNVSGDITTPQTMKCHTLKFDRSESITAGTQTPEHFHKSEHVGSSVYRSYLMKMSIESIQTTTGDADVIVTLSNNHGISNTATGVECKFTGVFANADINGITSSAGFNVNSSHRNTVTPHVDAKKMTVTLSTPATSSGTVNYGLANVILEFPRWYYVDMAKADGWQFAYGYIAPIASYL
jgi:hypothetical protein